MKTIRSGRRRAAAAWNTALVACALMTACGRESPAPTPAAATSARPAAPATAPAAMPRVAAANGTVYRWNDGDWILRATFTVTNASTSAMTVERAAFTFAEGSTWDASSTFPANVTLPPGGNATGDVAWYVSGSNPQPTTLNVTFAPAQYRATIPVVFSPAPPAPGTGPTAAVATLPITVTPPAISWVHTDGDRCVRVDVAVTNSTSAPLVIPREYFLAKAGGTDGSLWSEATTLPDPVRIAPGQTATGVVSWYWGGDPGLPSGVDVAFGPSNYPTAVQSNVPVTAGSAP